MISRLTGKTLRACSISLYLESAVFLSNSAYHI